MKRTDMRSIYRLIPAVAVGLLAASCARSDMAEAIGGETADGVIRYAIGAETAGMKSSVSADDNAACDNAALDSIVLTSADGQYSLTLYRTRTRTADGICAAGDVVVADGSKSAPVTGSNIDARYNDGSIQILALEEDGTTKYIPQQKLVFASRPAGSTSSLWKTEADYTWPETGKLSFWSWAPYAAEAAAGKLSDAAVSGGKLTFSYECPSTATEGKVAEAQSDVLVTYAEHSASDKGNVSLMYKHALSAICFKVDRANKCTVKSVSLGNVYSKGVCSFDGSSISWTGQSDATTYTETFNKQISEYLKDDYANPQGLSTEEGGGDAGKTFLLIPQSATDEKKVTMTLVVRLDGASEDLELSAELSPSGAIWEAGWTYTYGAGFDKKPKLVINVNVNERADNGAGSISL